MRKGQKTSEETKIKIGNANRGHKISDKQKKQLREANLGKVVPEEIRLKISKTAKLNGVGKWMLGRKTGIIPKSAFKVGHKINNNRKQTQEQIDKRIEKTSKDKHWNWQGGKTDKDKAVRNSLDYKLWRKACFERDNFTCQKTGVSGGELEVHHINNFSDFPELRLAIDNGITLSKKSHREFHKIYGVRNNTLEQLQEFLNN